MKVVWTYWRRRKRVTLCNSWQDALSVAWRAYKVERIASLPDMFYDEEIRPVLEACKIVRRRSGHLDRNNPVL